MEETKCYVCKEVPTMERYVHSLIFTAGPESFLGEGNEYELFICENCLMTHLGNYMRVTNV